MSETPFITTFSLPKGSPFTSMQSAAVRLKRKLFCRTKSGLLVTAEPTGKIEVTERVMLCGH